MAHWAELDANDNVLRVIVCDPDDDNDGLTSPPAFCLDDLGGRWVRTFYDTPGHTFAGTGNVWTGTAFVNPEALAVAVAVYADKIGTPPDVAIPLPVVAPLAEVTDDDVDRAVAVLVAAGALDPADAPEDVTVDLVPPDPDAPQPFGDVAAPVEPAARPARRRPARSR